MLNVQGTNITMTRGDTAKILLTLTQYNDTPYQPIEGDTIRFALKKSYSDSRTLMKIDIPAVLPLILHIKPSDTKKLAYGVYKYDIQLTRADGTVDTFIDRATFTLTEEVE